MKTKLSRRAALAGALSLAPAATPIGADADAELVAIGKQLIALYERDLEMRDFLAPYSEEFDKRLTVAEPGGIDETRRNGGSKAASELLVIKDAEIRQAIGPEFNAANEEHAQIIAAMGDPARRMFALPAHTILMTCCARSQRNDHS